MLNINPGKFLGVIRNKKNIIKIVEYITLMAILSVLIYQSYDGYKKTIIVQQQQSMLSTSRSISRSIELFTEEVVDSIRILTLDKDFFKNLSRLEGGELKDRYLEKLKSYYNAEGKAIDSIYLFDRTGKPLVVYPQSNTEINLNLKGDVNDAIALKKTHIGRVYKDKFKDTFILNISEPIFDGDSFKGVASVAISLDDIYERLISPVKIGEKGYAMVKDQDGIIIMHPVKEQVGMDVIETRKKVFPGLDYTELEELIENQLAGKEGTAVYHSYWWGNNKPEKAKKLSAYTPVKFGEYFWVVALTMSYDEIQEPINNFLIKILGIASLIASIIFIFIFALVKVRKSREELQRETEYLRILKDSSEQLRKKEAELYHSHKLKMIGTLAGGIAHDINNLLTPILGYSELLLARLSKYSEFYEEVDEIYKAAQRGKDLIEQILSFSRNETSTVKIQPIKINTITRETIKLIRSVIPKNVAVIENTSEDCGYINANYTQIHQVIFNLCTNAYQAIKNNNGSMEISLKRLMGEEITDKSPELSKNKNYVEIKVKDTGCGMDSDTKERIFEPFFTTKTMGDGTGLGLFVVKSIIENHKGVISVESEKGVGTCFNVYFPLLDEKVKKEDHSGTAAAEHENKKILIVDDNETNTKLLRRGLKHLGFEIFEETDSIRALEMIKANPFQFNLVITDYMMPGMKGSELSEAIKKLNRNIGVILMSGYIDESLEIINSNEYIDEYISKPIEMSYLIEVINRVLAD